MRLKRIMTMAGGLVMAALFIRSSLHWFQGRELGESALQLIRSPGILLLMTAGYGCSFILKAAAWRLYVGREREDHLRGYVYPLLVSLLVNHVLPIKLGDLARTGMLVRRTRMRWDDALHSVAVMRLLDMASLLLIGSIGALILGLEATGTANRLIPAGIIIILITLTAGLFINRVTKTGNKSLTIRIQSRFIHSVFGLAKRHLDRLWLVTRSPRGIVLSLLIFISWLLEGAVVYGVLSALNMKIGILQAVWANGMTIAGQLFHVTPGGIGTYETTLTASLSILGMRGEQAYTVALLSHGYKFVFAYAAGLAALLLAAVSWSDLNEWLRLREKKERNQS
ncbi:lysylphosphatidylglycerol synthase transmembrane domain-containing protein [Paenibacillus solisilvae]|uniref:Phosphatidylglycerol lysyltransferase n=1 Tax=Paenibacillus solisilvae TaxID=2486751 RepID=A0ABW0VPQ5_9BACL